MQFVARFTTAGFALAIVMVFLLAGCAREQDEPAEAVPEKSAAADSGPGVTVDAALQKRLGIETAVVISAPAQAVATGTAVVLDTAALTSTLDEIAAAAEDAAAQREHLQRLQHLYADGNTSLQTLEAARSQSVAARSRLTTAEARARVEWGAALIGGGGSRRALFTSGSAALLRAEFAGAISAAPAALAYTLAGDDTHASIAARFIDLSNAPTQSASGLAVTLLVPLSDAGNLLLRPGLRLTVLASTKDGPTQPLVPAGAVLADSGQLWCYVARAAGRFDRIAIAADARVGGGYPAPALAAGDAVVVRGAPLLLSLERGAGSTPAGGD